MDLNKLVDRWYAKLFIFLLSHNYKCFSAYHSLFLKHVGRSTIALLIYVDDIVLTGNDAEEMQAITSLPHHHFRIKNLGDLTYFLGFEVARNSSGIRHSQRKYTFDLLEETGMLAYAPVPTPMVHTVHLTVSKGIKLNDNKLILIEDSLGTSFILPTQGLIFL